MKKLIFCLCLFSLIQANAAEVKGLELSNSFLADNSKSFDPIIVKVRVKGKISSAALISNVSINGIEGFKKNEDLYFKVDYSGGHLVNYSPELDLSNVVVKGDIKSGQNSNLYNYNLVDVLNSSPNKKITAFISSIRPNRIINQLNLVYSCQENSNCEVTLNN